MDRTDVFELLDQAAAGRGPDDLRARTDAVAREAAWYQAQIGGGEPVYGATTLTGHLDSVRIPVDQAAKVQQRIIDSHCVGTAPFYPPATARLIGHAKARTVAAGGSGLSAAIFKHLLDTLPDPEFQPRIPALASYSCGDVIPGAHWARALLEHDGFARNCALQPGDALALINGNFVDLGATLALVPPLRGALAACAANSRQLAQAMGQPAESLLRASVPATVRPVLELVAATDGGDAAPIPAAPTQVEVSIRATPQLLAALFPAAATLVRVLGEELAAPSANPMVSAAAQRIDSQASFMSPRLSIAKSGLAEAVLFASWACQGRIAAVARRLEANGGEGFDGLDVIQVPKLTQAWLEESRLRLGRRLFASGSDTSQGIEDLWTFGTIASAQLDHGIATWTRMEATLSLLLRLLQSPSTGDSAAVLDALRGGAPLPDTVAGDASLHDAVTATLRHV